MCIKKSVVFLSLLGVCLTGSSQTSISDTVIHIDEVKVYANLRDRYSIGSTSQIVDSILLKRYVNRTVSDLLSTYGVNIKSYGLGGLSTIAMRGGGASHTAVVWNGLNVVNPMNGNSNLSLLPVGMLSTIKLQHGGSGTLYGSGAVTGILYLTSDNIYNQPGGISVASGYGSGNTRNITVGLRWRKEKVAFSLKGFKQKADNNFEFYNTYKLNSPKERISHAGVDQWGVVSDLSSKLSCNLSWSISGWYQFNNKDLQTLMSSTIPSQANQVDKSLLISSNLKYQYGRLAVNLKNGVNNGEIVYTDRQYATETHNRFNSLINEIESKFALNTFNDFDFGINYTREYATSGDYTESPTRNRLSTFIFYYSKLFDSRFFNTLSFRSEAINGDIKPIVYSWGSEFKLVDFLKIKASASKTYRIPSLNDLYWANTTYTAGNPNLKPESGWSDEMGLEFNRESLKSKLNISLTAFYTNIDDWIVWLSDPNLGGKWTPYNLDNGKTLGLELNSLWNISLGSIIINSNIFYTYTHSIIYSSSSYDGNEMIYTPKNKISGSISILWKNVGISYNHSFTGERYADYVNKLISFNVADLSVDYTFIKYSTKFNVRFTVNNILNESYQLIAAYAMPLRNYMLALTVDINQPKN